MVQGDRKLSYSGTLRTPMEVCMQRHAWCRADSWVKAGGRMVIWTKGLDAPGIIPPPLNVQAWVHTRAIELK